MTEYFITLPWFRGVYVVFEMIALVVAFLIAFFSYRAYKYTAQKQFLMFAGAFLSIGFSFALKMVAHTLVFVNDLETKMVGSVVITQYVPQQIEWINLVGLFLHRFSMLFGYLIILAIVLRIRDQKIFYVLTYFIFITTIFSYNSYFVFHLTSIVLLLVIVGKYYYHYIHEKTQTTLPVAIAFTTLLISQILFILLAYTVTAYAIAEALQLIGFLILLYAYRCITKKC
ncbi:hypothetical protein HYW21_02785 [Candidatus Woesearchaeota archaeon]|nr:hypothetical protein [Candidatus Woesearchaeota archaeon]